ncbi:MAG TPA: hypothetical protein VFU21_13045 [Kofleriaceae bacterium]|nr:hypothetical protein [Kofleriaceae bacterium]
MSATFPRIEPERDRPADADFFSLVNRVMAGLVFRYRPELVCTMQIERWFDHKWLGYSGKGRVSFDTPHADHPGVSLDPFFQDQLTFPPFNPNRVRREVHWRRDENGGYSTAERTFWVHPRVLQHSARNLHRRVLDATDSGLFVWYSSGAAAPERASLMVYVVNQDVAIPWFAAFERSEGSFRLAAVRGLGREEVLELIDHPPIGRSV